MDQISQTEQCNETRKGTESIMKSRLNSKLTINQHQVWRATSRREMKQAITLWGIKTKLKGDMWHSGWQANTCKLFWKGNQMNWTSDVVSTTTNNIFELTNWEIKSRDRKIE